MYICISVHYTSASVLDILKMSMFLIKCKTFFRQQRLTGSPINSKAWPKILKASSAPGWVFCEGKQNIKHF